MNPDETVEIAVTADTGGLTRALDDLTQRANGFGSALTSALRGAVTGGRSLDTVLSQLALRISTLALDAALKPLQSLAGAALQQVLPGIAGGLSGNGSGVIPFAKGGIVASPSYFPAGRQLGLMGEAGGEAILPLRRGADGSLGVAAERGVTGAGPSIVVNVTTPDAPSFRRAETQIQTMLARAVGRGRRGL
ncbi:phage tail tape measure protein [Mangrovibrevibacter kandeliae]|uniref:phage tail tape measure protein n=1 Tax=Mangrovibrevibacter kandeliae TaxID=2968473 RepID=UPI002118F799|nr:phage tail tape measure protein [Aurantimonas sp. CSK15Z-1]MCQ8781086.1 phage tail tape measure protein [Aurantimonas sp. CSK15Z-1]